jgi:hypothetical protein
VVLVNQWDGRSIDHGCKQWREGVCWVWRPPKQGRARCAVHLLLLDSEIASKQRGIHLEACLEAGGQVLHIELLRSIELCGSLVQILHSIFSP